jgi:hypothetical protein
MIQYMCDMCGKGKSMDDEVWILGFGEEDLGLDSARREVIISPAWDEQRAREFLAVHFCSERCKDQYVAALFGNVTGETYPGEAVGELPPTSAKKTAISRRQRTSSRPMGNKKRRGSISKNTRNKRSKPKYSL